MPLSTGSLNVAFTPVVSDTPVAADFGRRADDRGRGLVAREGALRQGLRQADAVGQGDLIIIELLRVQARQVERKRRLVAQPDERPLCRCSRVGRQPSR